MTLLCAAVAVGFAVVIVLTALAIRQPWMGLTLAASGKGGVVVRHVEGPAGNMPTGVTVVAIRGGEDELNFEPLDFAVEPDGTMGDYATYRRFLDRQDRMARMLGAGEVEWVAEDGRVFAVQPDRRGRPVRTLPVEFWVQMTVGLVAWLIAAGVFVFRPKVASARYLLLSGVATLVFAPFAAVYSTRELALPGTLFGWLSDLNFFGGSLYAASLVGLLLHYPRPIGPRWIGVAVVMLYAGWFALQQIGVFESMTFARRFLVMLGVLATFALSAAHWFRTRWDAVARASLQWFLLSWVVGTSAFGLFILLPQMFGIDTSELQGYAFLLFLLVYVGLGFGILRFRLFDLGEWWGRMVVWALAILLLVGLDLIFLLVLNLSSGLSLSLALLACGVVWLPLRAMVWGRLFKRGGPDQAELFQQVVDVAFTPPGGDQRQRWEQLLRTAFDPLRLVPQAGAVETVLTDDGMALVVRGVAPLPAVRLEHARGGRRLFTPADASLAEALTTMLRHTIASRTAYEKGVAQERTRIARDIHDHIGAQLLGALHGREPERKDGMIRGALADLRDIINDAMNSGRSLDEVLAGLRVETAERLSAAGIELNWEAEAKETGPLPAGLMHGLRSIVREAVSNVIKHAGARNVSLFLRCNADEVELRIEDDGRGFDPASLAAGHGLGNVKNRVTGLRGELRLDAEVGTGTRLKIRLPRQPGKKFE